MVSVQPAEPAGASAQTLRIDLTDKDAPRLEWQPVKPAHN